MRGAVRLLRLKPRPGVDPHADGGGSRGEGGLGGHSQPVGEGCHAGLGRAQDPRVVRRRGHRGPVFQEARVRVLEPAELGFHGLSKTVVDHRVGWWRGGARGGFGDCWPAGEEADGRETAAAEKAGDGEEVVECHDGWVGPGMCD